MDRTAFPENIILWIETLWDKHHQGGGQALDWLRGRGLEDESIRGYHFGYVTDGHFADSVSIPLLDGRAVYRAVRFRRLSGGPKYDQPKLERPHLFNVSSVRHRDVYLTEGEFDAVILEQSGRHAVGVPGINNFREEWAWLFAGNVVRIVFDAEMRFDEAHNIREAWKQVQSSVSRLRRILEPIADDVLVVELPIGHDVTSLYVESSEALEEVLRQYDS